MANSIQTIEIITQEMKTDIKEVEEMRDIIQNLITIGITLMKENNISQI